MTEPLQTRDAGSVLVVEDDESTALFVTRVLRRHGFRAAWVVDAEQATSLLKGQSFDVLLADYRLPGRSGLELASDTRRLVPEMGIAVMTSFSGNDIEGTARSSGADDYFEKPLYPTNFVTRITALVRQSRSSVRSSKTTPPARAADVANPVATVPGTGQSDDAPTVPQIAESGSGEQAPVRGGALAWRDTDRTSGSGGPLGEGTGGIGQARCSAFLKLGGEKDAGAEDDGVPDVSGLTERDLRARAAHPSAWRRGRQPPPFLMWVSAGPGTSVESAPCWLTSPQLHTGPST